MGEPPVRADPIREVEASRRLKVDQDSLGEISIPAKIQRFWLPTGSYGSVASLMAEAHSFIGAQPQKLLGCARRLPEDPVRPDQQPYSRAVTSVGASPRAPIPLTAEATSPLGAI